MCGDYSNACGGGGVIVNECAGVVDFTYSDCCTGEVVHGGYGHSGEVLSETVTQEQAVHEEGSPSEGTVVDHKEPATEPMPETVLPAETAPPANFVEEDPAPMPTGPRPSDDLTEDLFADDMPPDSVPDDSGVTTERDLFGDEPTQQPADTDNELDDLFGDEPAAQPAEEDGELDDLFGDEPAAQPAEEDDELDDLFGDESAAQPADQDDELDNLFGDEPTAATGAADESFPADTPKEDLSADDEMPMDDGGLEDLFGDDPGEADPADADELNDLFGDEPSRADATDDELDDLFGDGADTKSAAGPEQLTERSKPDNEPSRMISFVSNRMPMRAWWDNTGKYRTIGRLLAVGDDSVRLSKANGRTCTVPFYRLSAADLNYVRTQIERYGEALKVAAN